MKFSPREWPKVCRGIAKQQLKKQMFYPTVDSTVVHATSVMYIKPTDDVRIK